jgi:putative transposase
VKCLLNLEIINNEFVFHGRSMQITKDKNTLLEPHGKMVSNCGIILQLLPTDEQATNLNQQIGNARFVRNNYLTERINLYTTSKTTLSPADYKKNYLPALKNNNPFLLLSDKFALESAVEHVDNAYNNFFDNLKKGKKAGFPKFTNKYKPNGNSYTTKFTNNNIELLMVDNIPYLKLPKIGKVRFILPIKQTISTLQPFNARITSVTIKKHNGIYTASIQMEAIVDIPKQLTQVNINDIIAIDMGIKDFGIYGNKNTTKVKNPRFIKLHEKRLRRLQQSLSRKQLRSKNWEKAKLKVAKEQRKIKNQRKDFHHKLSRKIVNECNVFVCEDLNVKGLVKNHKLAKEISSVGWSQFLTYVKYKLERKGGLFIKVNRFYASTKLCSHCGHKKTDLQLKDRYWVCPQCSTKHDRDINAKTNLLNEGIRLLTTNYNIQVI